MNLGSFAGHVPNNCMEMPMEYKLKTLLLIMLMARMKRKKYLTFPSGVSTYSISAADDPSLSANIAAHSAFDHSADANPAPQVMAKAGSIQIPEVAIINIFHDDTSTGKYT